MSITYKLKNPLVEGSEEVTELVFMQPTVGLLKQADGCKGDMEKSARYIQILCNIRPRLVDKITSVDLVEINEIIASFFPKATYQST